MVFRHLANTLNLIIIKDTNVSELQPWFFGQIVHVNEIQLDGTIVTTDTKVDTSVIEIPAETHHGSQASSIN